MLRAAPSVFNLDNFYMGLDWTAHPSKVEVGWLVDAKNFSLNSYRALEKRAGCALLRSVAFNSGAAIKSIYEYKAPGDAALSFPATNFLLVSSGTALGYWGGVAGEEWELITNTLTAGLRMSFATHDGYCYCVNGTDSNFKIFNTTKVDVVGLQPPATAPTVLATGTGFTGTYKYVYAFVRETFPALIGNYSPASNDVTVANQGVALTGSYSDDPQVDHIAIFRTLDMGTGDTDSNQYFQVIRIANDHTVNNTLTKAYVGSGLDDLGTIANTLDSTVNLRVQVMAAKAVTVTAAFKGSGLNDLHTPANTVDNTVNLIIKCVSLAGGTINHYKVSADGGLTYPGVGQDMSTGTCTYGNTTWHWNSTAGHVVGDTWTLSKVGDTYAVSEDEGSTWGPNTNMLLTANTWKNTTWNFAAVTGHTANGYWTIKTTSASDWAYTDTKEDNDLTLLATNDNTPPPKSKFIILHKNRMFYANCPAEKDGASLFMFSAPSAPERVPSTNYQYFDKADGNPITGIASLPESLIVFKKNKIAVMEGDFVEWYTISNGIGCIAPWAIVPVGGKVYFISEEGWKATDGRTVFDVGKKLQAINRAQYLTTAAAAEYTAIYYPEKFQLQFNLYHATYNNIVLVAHLLESLYQDSGEQVVAGSNFIGYTYHEYDNHVFTTLGWYTDANGITRPVAGSSTGFLYLLDSGTQDEGNNIAVRMETGWYDFGTPASLTKTMRGISVSYASSATTGTGVARLYYDVDFVTGTDYVTLTKGGAMGTTYPFTGAPYTGVDGVVSENLDVVDSMVGQKFRFILTDTSANRFTLLSVNPYFRIEGRR